MIKHQNIEEVLNKIIANEYLHAKWLNGLSYLEFSGARKICKNIPAYQINFEMLLHFQEETRHALYLKKLALKINSQMQSYDDLFVLKKKSLQKYLRGLENEVNNFFIINHDIPTAVYLWTTKLIEERAIYIYNIYQVILEQRGMDISLRPILLDEEKHLHYVHRHFKNDYPELKVIEEKLFNEMWSVIEEEMQS